MSVLRRDFLPANLLAETQANHVSGVISVQARQIEEETRWLLSMASNHDWILGVVGWLPLQSPTIRESMERFRHEAKLCGLRHVVQDEQDDGFLDRPDFNNGIRLIREFGWTYDLLIYARQLPFAIPFVDRHPDQVSFWIISPNLRFKLTASRQLGPRFERVGQATQCVL